MTHQELQDYIYSLTEREVASKAKDIAKLYQVALDDITKEMGVVYAKYLSQIKNGEDYYAAMVKYDRLEKLEKSIINTFNDQYRKIGATIGKTSSMAGKNTYYRMEYATNWIEPYNFVPINTTALNYAVTGNVDLLNKVVDASVIGPNSGKTLKKILKDNNAIELNRILGTVNNSLLRGVGFRETARNLRDTFDSNVNNSLRVVRTESHRLSQTGAYMQAVDAQNAGVPLLRKISSTLDSRTRAQSGAVDGRIDEGDGFLYPDGNRYKIPGNTGRASWDINDREVAYQIIEGMEPEVRRGRNPATGENEIISYKAFPEWAKDNGLKYNDFGELVA